MMVNDNKMILLIVHVQYQMHKNVHDYLHYYLIFVLNVMMNLSKQKKNNKNNKNYHQLTQSPVLSIPYNITKIKKQTN